MELTEAAAEIVEKVISRPGFQLHKSIGVSVPEPSLNRVKDGKIQPYSGNTSLMGWWKRDVWREAELYLTNTTLCYKIEGMGVS